ncbi:transcription initiation factor TFIID subunit 1-like [Striga asiatica]|uniref:Transcription initiation factor TFIID subunit 1-like n=1 Tax=Striga asiatica TaxID=4170 RepID=A0A5A7QSH7_STRAF|nr:transcription initiation factor TFIID subunit 1-like [Striga asiatica]
MSNNLIPQPMFGRTMLESDKVGPEDDLAVDGDGVQARLPHEPHDLEISGGRRVAEPEGGPPGRPAVLRRRGDLLREAEGGVPEDEFLVGGEADQAVAGADDIEGGFCVGEGMADGSRSFGGAVEVEEGDGAGGGAEAAAVGIEGVFDVEEEGLVLGVGEEVGVVGVDELGRGEEAEPGLADGFEAGEGFYGEAREDGRHDILRENAVGGGGGGGGHFEADCVVVKRGENVEEGWLTAGIGRLLEGYRLERLDIGPEHFIRDSLHCNAPEYIKISLSSIVPYGTINQPKATVKHWLCARIGY